MKEVGPFVYNLKIKKVPVIDNNNDTVSYRELKQWFFNPEQSAYDEDYVITTVNAPLISALNFIQRAPQPLRTWISITLDTITEGIFIRRSIKQLTFYGYPDILVSIGTLIDPKTPNTNGRFAYLAQKNNTAEAEYTLFSGVTDQKRLGLVEKVDGRSYITKWKEYPCRNLNDTYTGQILYSPLESFRTNIQMFNDLFGRKMNLKYRGIVESYPGMRFRYIENLFFVVNNFVLTKLFLPHTGINTYRYSFDENNFKNSIDFPPNACYTSRLPKVILDIPTNGTGPNNHLPVERQSSPGSILLNLARRRFSENAASPLANLFNRNILSRPIVGISNPQRPPTLQPTTTTSTTTTTTTTSPPDVHNSNYETAPNEEGDEQPAVDEFDANNRSNSAESLIMTTETSILSQPIRSNAHSNGGHSNHHPQSTTTTTHQPPRVYSHSYDHPSDSNMPRDANLFGSRTGNPESRQDQFGSSLGSIFSNRVRESPLLSLFVPRETASTTNNSPDNSRGRLFNRNGNNVLGNLISNGLNRLLSLRNARRMEESSGGNHESNNVDNEPNRTVLSRSVRNALRRVTRNTGPVTTRPTNRSAEYEYVNQNPNGKVLGRTTHEEYAALRKQNMFPSGAFDFSEIAFGAPILLSQPHFLNADSYYNDRVSCRRAIDQRRILKPAY